MGPSFRNIMRKGHTNGGYRKCLGDGFGAEVWTNRMGPGFGLEFRVACYTKS